jgi:hypothetical protein
MSYVIICKRDGRPPMHVYKPNVMSIWGAPHVYNDKDVAMAEAREWATLYKGMHPDYKVVVKPFQPPAPEPAPKKIVRHVAEPVKKIIRRSV